MKYDEFFCLSCIVGDELYKLNSSNKDKVSDKLVVERFNQVWDQPIGDFYLSGLPPVIRRNARRVYC
ncbi:hypothetical protein GCM10027299_37070 [Larkinella ripae]